MKYLILLGLFSLNTGSGLRSNNRTSTINTIVYIKTNNGKPTTKNIRKVDESFFEDSIEGVLGNLFSTKDLKSVNAKFASIESDPKISPANKRYWESYLLYNMSIFYKAVLKDDNNSEKKIDLAIETMAKSPKSSDDYALLAACKSFSLQFASMTQLASISAEVSENANKSLEINSKNIRAYYVLASNNFYTPKMFGGMVKVEEFSLKGLSCPNSLDEAFYSPYWGKPKLYSIYITYLKSENRKEDADKYKALAKKEFPGQF